MTIRRLLSISALAIAASACGESDIGEECDVSGATSDCVADAVCTGESGETAYCRFICTAQEDCPEGQNCNGVSNSSLKSCQP